LRTAFREDQRRSEALKDRAANSSSKPAPDDPDTQPLEEELRLGFALPSLSPSTGAPPKGHGAQSISAAFASQGIYNRWDAAEAFSPQGALQASPDTITGKIVVLSTSAPTALDRYNTPIGILAGAELILNAVNGYSMGSCYIPPEGVKRVYREAFLIFVASLPFLAFWICYFLAREHFDGSKLSSALVGLGALTGFICTIALAMGLAMSVALASGRSANSFALEPFTPVLALALEGFAEAARWLADRIEHLVLRTHRSLSRFHSRRPTKANPSESEP
jgi:hypothetical protein